MMSMTGTISYLVLIAGTMCAPLAHAGLVASTTINLRSPTIQIVDLMPGDQTAPVFVLTPEQASAAVLDWGPFDRDLDTSTDWNTPLSAALSSSQPAASGTATYGGAASAVATTTITGYVEGNTFSSSTDHRATFVLGAGTEVTFEFPVSLMMSGADPYDPAHEAYAIVQAYFQNAADLGVLASDIVRQEAWMGDLPETASLLSLTIANTGAGDITGWLDISGMVETISRVQPPPQPTPEPATLLLCLVGLGIAGFATRCRRTCGSDKGRVRHRFQGPVG